MNSSPTSSDAPIGGGVRLLLSVGLAMLLAGLAWLRVDMRGNDAPTATDWAQDGFPRAASAAERGPLASALDLLKTPHFAETWPRARILSGNGQWDPRLDALLGSVMLALGLGALAYRLDRGASGATGLLPWAITGACLAFPAVAEAMATPSAVEAGLVLLAAVVALARSHDEKGSNWTPVAAAIGALVSTYGAAACLALALDSRRSGRTAVRVVLGAVGLATLVRGLAAGGTFEAMNGATMLGVWFAMPVVWSRSERPSVDVTWRRWAGLLSLILVTIPGDASPWLPALGVVGVWSTWGGLEHPRRAAVLAVAAWTIGAVVGLDALSRTRPTPLDPAVESRERTAALREAKFGLVGAEKLAERLNVAPETASRILVQLGDPSLQRWLPASLREPLDLTFAAPPTGTAPELPALPPGLHPVGTWTVDAPGSATGTWTSRPLASSAPLLQFYLAGYRAEGSADLLVRGADGTVQHPLERRIDATAAWRRINIPAPASPFVIEIQDASPEAWLAVAGPVELGHGTWIAGKLAGAAPMLAIAGVLVAGLASWFSARSAVNRRPDSTTARPWTIAGVCALIGLAVMLWFRVDNVAAGSDAAGYLESARLLGDGAIRVPPRAVSGFESPTPWLYTPLGYVPQPDGQLIPSYPTGLPLMYMLIGKFVGLSLGVTLVIWIHLVLAGWAIWRLAQRCGLPPSWALIAAGLSVANPVALYIGLQPMSDLPSLVWLAFAMEAALRGRDRKGWALAAGFATSVLVLLRPANAIAFVPLLICLGGIRPIIFWALGAIPAACWQLGHAWAAYGNPLTTGYGDPRGGFALHWLAPTLKHYVVELTMNFTPLVWLGAAGAWLGRGERRMRAALVATVLVYFGFYAFYFCTHETWWYLRFVLPAFPAVVILALMAWRRLLEPALAQAVPTTPCAWVAAALLVLGAHQAWQITRHPVLDVARGNEVYTGLIAALDRDAPASAAVFAFQASGAVHHYTSRTVLRFDQVEPEVNLAVARQLLRNRQDVYAVVLPFDLKVAGDRIPRGKWTVIARLRDAEVWRLEALDSP